eukprot:jgi/Chrzof1/1319/Cz10g02260.t1
MALRCAATLAPGGPARAPDNGLQSLVESGIRGSMAVGVAYGLHLNLFQTLHWHPADVAVALQSALPVMMLDAVMLLPHYKPSKPSGQQQQVAGATPPAQNAAVHGSSQRAWLLKSALSSVQSHSLRYSLAGVSSRPRSFLLTSAAELSDDLLGRAVIFGMAVDWIQDRCIEASSDDYLHAGLLHPATGDVAKYIAATAICCIMSTRYLGQGRKAAAVQEHAHRLKLLKYEPLKVQQQQAALEGTAAAADEASLAEQQGLNEAVTALLHVLLGARFVSGQAAMYAAYIATDNLLASFMTGMLAQMYHTACCRRIQGRR